MGGLLGYARQAGRCSIVAAVIARLGVCLVQALACGMPSWPAGPLELFLRAPWLQAQRQHAVAGQRVEGAAAAGAQLAAGGDAEGVW